MTDLFRPSAADPEDVLAGLGRSWAWVLAVGGVSLAAGVIMLAWPEVTLRIVAIVIGVELLVAGGWGLVTAFAHSADRGGARVLAVFLALLSVLAGVLVLRHQLQTVGALTLVVGAFWLLSGLLAVYLAISDRQLAHRGVRAFFGAVGVIAGVVVLAYPVQTASALARLLGLWLVLLGLVDVGLAFALRSDLGQRGTTATTSRPRSVG